MNVLRAPCSAMYVVLREFQSKELSSYRYLRHSSKISLHEAVHQAKVLWTAQVSKVTVLIRDDDGIMLR